MTVKDGKGERQKNVPISETYHRELQAISLIDKKSMKEIVEGYIISDGRGKTLLEKADDVDNAESVESPDGSEKATAASQ